MSQISHLPAVARDERTLAVENAGYRWAYLFLSFGVLALVAWRGFARDEAAWDLLALVVLGGALSAGYQGLHKVLTRQWALLCLLTIVVAAAVAVVVSLVS